MRSLKFPSHLFFLVLPIFLVLSAHRDTQANPGGPPLRLRVQIEKNKLQSGESTKVVIDLLDKYYQPVANDATRVITLDQSSAGSRLTGAGSISTRTIQMRPGEMSKEAVFTSGRSGRLFIDANAEGLEAGRALVLIVSQRASLFSQLFETVAYARPETGFEISPKKHSATADNLDKAIFNVSFEQEVSEPTVVNVRTNLPDGTILYKDQKVGGTSADIMLAKDEDFSGNIAIQTTAVGTFDVFVSVPHGPKDHASVSFNAPRPTQIRFDVESPILSQQRAVNITVYLAAEGDVKAAAERDVTIRLRSAFDPDRFSFEQDTLIIKKGEKSASTTLHLNQLPYGNEIKLLASTDQELSPGVRGIQINSPIQKLLLSGPKFGKSGGGKVEFTITLADKANNPMPADWERKVELNIAGDGSVTREFLIPKDAEQITVTYDTPRDTGTYEVTATSKGVNSSSYELIVPDPPALLVGLSLIGALVGGLAKQLHKDARFERIRPMWTGKVWEVGLVGRLFGSVVGGVFLYSALKLGLTQRMGSPVVGSAELGTWSVAFFFGGVGGFAGTLVLDRFVGWFVPENKKATAKSIA